MTITEADLAEYERNAEGSAEHDHHEDCEATATGNAEDCECSVVPMADAIHALVAAVRSRNAEIARLRVALTEIADVDRRREEFVLAGPRAMAGVVRLAKLALEGPTS